MSRSQADGIKSRFYAEPAERGGLVSSERTGEFQGEGAIRAMEPMAVTDMQDILENDR